MYLRVDLSNAWKSGGKLLDSAVSLLPNLVLAAVIVVLFLVVASAVKSGVRRLSRKRERQNLGLLLGQLAQVTVLVLGFLIALSAVAPSFHASDLIKMLGIGSVAIGFAFQNILQNFLAGILLLIQEPFQVGDTITVEGLEGTVEDIATRATVVSTSDGHKVVIPNAVLFTNPVVVRDASNQRQPKEQPETAPDGTGASVRG
jgi:small conductance mechanosensitive channel